MQTANRKARGLANLYRRPATTRAE